jgi:hypothetical protein
MSVVLDVATRSPVINPLGAGNATQHPIEVRS